MKRVYHRQLSDEALAELQRIAELKAQIPSYKALAEKHGVCYGWIAQCIHRMTRDIKRQTHVVHRGTTKYDHAGAA